MVAARTRVLLILSSDTWYNREVSRGAIAYAHQHTDWQLIRRWGVSATQARKVRPAGMLVTGPSRQEHCWAYEAGVPIVSVGGVAWDARSSHVAVDDQAIGRLAAEYFSGRGIRHLAYVGHGSWAFVQNRRNGLAQEAARLGLEMAGEWIGPFYDLNQRPRFERQLESLLCAVPRPCGVLTADDEIGAFVVEICRNAGLRVPDDIAVLGVNNDELSCELSEVPLSSIPQPLPAIGYQAARLLHQRMGPGDARPQTLLLPPLPVVSRASSDLISLEDEDVAAALRLIQQYLAEPINVDWLIRQLPVARRSLYRKFKKLVGRTILQQIHHVRFQKAMQLLAESDQSLSAVARQSGFVSARWMAESFRRRLRTTPVQFRSQCGRTQQGGRAGAGVGGGGGGGGGSLSSRPPSSIPSPAPAPVPAPVLSPMPLVAAALAQ